MEKIFTTMYEFMKHYLPKTLEKEERFIKKMREQSPWMEKDKKKQEVEP